MPSTMTPSENQMDYDSSGAGSLICQCLKHLGAKITPLLFFIQWLNTILLPPRLAQQLLWSRCINTAGRPGCNIPMDLHMEHLNRSCKSAIANLKANIVPSAIVRIGKCLGPLTNLCDAFSKASNGNPHSSAHSEAKFHDDLEKIVTELMKNEVFSYFPNRKHTSLPNFHGSLLDKINSEQMKDYIKKHSKILV